MTETATGFGSSLVQEFKSLTTKQWAGIVAALAIALVLEIYMGTACMGFFIVAVVLYMIPHILGVESVKIKTIVGVVFAVVAITAGTFAYSGTIAAYENGINTTEKDTVQNIVYDEDAGTMTFSIVSETRLPGDDESPREWHGIMECIPVQGIAFGTPNKAAGDSTIYRETSDSKYDKEKNGILTVTYDGMKDDKHVYTCVVSDFKLEDGKLYLFGMGVVGSDNNVSSGESTEFMIDTGCDRTAVYFTGTAYTVAFALVIFFMILIFSTAMRRSAEKSRKKMEAEGRLYPQGYGRCKNCGAMVLPGEINCRKCGTYIDVPEELRAKKKDFFQCTECGAEVPSDAEVCPKCGAKFEGSETEIVHEDGSVEVSEGETETCPDCDNPIPPGAEWCPKCGRMLKKE